MNPLYFRGVAVGLTIAWVTTAIAYYVPAGSSSPVLLKLAILELIISIAMFIVSFVMKG